MFCNFNILILITVLALHIPLYLNIPEDGDLTVETCRTFEETFGYVRSERVNKWPKSMIDI